MQSALAYLPIDRRAALAADLALPERARGAVLFADISGFTLLTNSLVDELGPRRGAEEATRQLNLVYDRLVQEIHTLGGSAVSFSGDGMLCWFEGSAPSPEAEAAQRALRAAASLHAGIAEVAAVLASPRTPGLGLKVAVAAGMVRRFVVGDPAIQLFDVLAGEPVEQTGAAEPLAHRRETMVDAATTKMLSTFVDVTEWRTEDGTGRRFAVLNLTVENLAPTADAPASDFAPPRADIEVLAEEVIRPWLPPALYARLAAGQERYLAELRPAVALFVRFQGLDLVRDETAAAKLDGYVRWVQGVLAQHGGVLVQVTTGDKGAYLYAAFGAIIVHDDDPQRAAAAALELVETPASLAPIRRGQVGLARGRMRVGAYGSAERRTYGVQGAAVNLAARLMMVAKSGQVVADSGLVDGLQDLAVLEDLGPVPLKGMATPRRLYAVIALRSPAEVGQKPTRRLVFGRDAELDQVRQAAGHTRAGQGRVIAIAGVLGIGKSTLLGVCAEELAADGWRVAWCQGQATRQHVAYDVIGQLLRGILALPKPEAGREQDGVAWLQAWVAAVEPTWMERLPLLREVLGLPLAESATTVGLDARSRQQATVALVLSMVRTVAGQGPGLAGVDDWQWLDEASRTVVEALADAADDLPLLLAVASRSDASGAADVVRQADLTLSLQGLDPPAVAALAEAQLDGPLESTAAGLVTTLVQGNPLFAELVVDALREAGQVERRQDGWHLAEAVLDALREGRALVATEEGWRFVPEAVSASVVPGLPETVDGLVLARLDRLPEDAKLALKVASVIGRTFEFDVLARAHPLLPEPEALRNHLAVLQGQELIHPVHYESRAGYTFSHNLVQEVAYQTLLGQQQRDLHVAVGEALEQVQPRAVEQLAYHFNAGDLDNGDVRAKALWYLDQAAIKMRQEHANMTALRFLEQALALEKRWAWAKARVEILHLLGRRSEEQAALARLAGEREVEPGELALLASRYYEAVNEYLEAAAAAQQALDLARENKDRRLEVAADVQMASVVGREGDYAAEATHYEAALAALADDGLRTPAAIDVYFGLGTVRQQQGDYAAAEAHLKRAHVLAQQQTRLTDEAKIMMALGIVARQTRRFEEASSWTEKSLRIRRVIGDRAGEAASLLSLAQVFFHGLGDYGRALAVLQEVLVLHQRLRDRWHQALIYNELGIVYLLVGLWKEASHSLESALSLCREIGAMAGLAHVLCNLGQVQREQGELDESAASFAEGLAIAQELGDTYTEAQYWSEIAQLALRRGDPQVAEDGAAKAIAYLSRMELEVMTTCDLCTLAQARHMQGDATRALAHARRARRLLDECQGEGPDYPQRDYFRCAEVLQACGEVEAAATARAAAHRLLAQRAERIRDPALRQSFLEAIPIHAAIWAHGSIASVPP